MTIPIKDRSKRSLVIERKKKFLKYYEQTHNLGESYIKAGFSAKNITQACSAANQLLRRMDKHLNFSQILDSAGLTDRYISDKIKAVVDDTDPRVSVKGLNLVTRCKGHQVPTNAGNMGVQIVINTGQSPSISTQPSNQGQSTTIDVQPNRSSIPDTDLIDD